MATLQQTPQPEQAQQTISRSTSIMRTVYLVIACIFLAGLFLQLFLAGVGVFLGQWGTHVSFGRPFGVVTVLLLIAAFAARLPARQIWLTALLIPLYTLQILLIELPGRLGVIILSALHPVNAGLMLWITVLLVRWAWKASHS
ncbi:MAG TPA: DUF6220 domain-containing protein [Ktedonobacteraceae bacterium]